MILLHVDGLPISDEAFFRRCTANRDLRLERTAQSAPLTLASGGFFRHMRSLWIYPSPRSHWERGARLSGGGFLPEQPRAGWFLRIQMRSRLR